MYVISSEARNLEPLKYMKISPVGRNDNCYYLGSNRETEFPQQ